jgi:hypothetical protein
VTRRALAHLGASAAVLVALASAAVCVGVLPSVSAASALPRPAIGPSRAVSGPPSTPGIPPEEFDCPEEKLREVNAPAKKRRFEPTEPIRFSVHQSSPVINFGSDRDVQADYVVLKASKPLPPGVFSDSFELDTREPLRRIGAESLESGHLSAPRFTPPYIFNHRTEIGFNLCVDASGGSAGTYTGQFLMVGPGAIRSALITQSIQMKAESWEFWIGLAVVEVLAIVALLARALSRPNAKPRSGWWWLTILLTIALQVAVSILALVTLWETTTNWGETRFIAYGTLLTTAFAAIGLAGLVSSGAEGTHKS